MARHPRARKWAIRIAKGLGYTIASVLGLVVLALCVVLFTPWGTRTALSYGLGVYDGMMPGHARVAAVRGTLATTLELDGLELTDAQDQPLVRVASLVVDFDLTALVRVTLAFGELAAQGVEVHLWEGQSGFGDLAPPGPDKPKEPGTAGPNMPLGLSGGVAIDGFDLVQHPIDGPDHATVRAAMLHGNLFWKGRIAEVDIEALSAMIDDAELAVAGASGSIDWDDPIVRVEGLTVVTNRGVVQRADVELDALALEGEVELAAVVDVNSLAPKSNLPIYGMVGVQVKGAGGKAHAWTQVAVDAAPMGRLEVLLGGSIDPRLDLAGAGVIDVAAVPGKPSTALFTAVHVVREPDSPLRAGLVARGGAARAPVGVIANAEVARDGSPIDVDAFVYAGDSTIDASAIIRDAALARADATVNVPTLAGLRTAVRPWVDLPAMSGSAGAKLGCTGAGTRLDCEAEAHVLALAIADARVGTAKVGAFVGLRDGEPHGDVSLHAERLKWQDRKVHELDVAAAGDLERLHVEVAGRAPEGNGAVSADVAIGPRTVVDLRHLVVKSHPLWVKLDGDSRIAIEGKQVDIDGLDLVINGGRVHVDGAVGERNDARVAVTRFDLAALDVLRLPVKLRGVFEARGRFQGQLADPRVQLDAALFRFQVDDQALGTIETDLDLRERHAVGKVVWRSEHDERAEIDANVDLRPFDSPRGFGLAPGRPVALVAEVEGVELSRLRTVIGDEKAAGEAGLTLRVSGTPEKPEVALVLTVGDARVKEFDVDMLEVTASHVDGRVEATVQAASSWLAGLRVEANAPARLRLAPPYFRLDRDGDIEAALAVDDLQLSAAKKAKPELALGGSIDVDLVARVHGGRTQADLALVASDLAVDGKPVGDAGLDATLGDDRLQATLQLRGAAAKHVEARVDIPMEIAALRGKARWRKEADQLVELDIEQADVGALTRLAGLSGFSGVVDGDARLAGPAAKPELVASFAGKRLVASGRPIGEVELSVEHADGRVEAHVHQRQGVAQRIAVDAAVPLAVDLAAGKVNWDEDGAHDVDVHAIGVDETIVQHFAALPDGMRLDVNARLAARGNPSDFQATGQVRASVGQQSRVDVPIAITLEADPYRQSTDVVIGPFGESTITLAAAAELPVVEVVKGEADLRAVPIRATLNGNGFPLTALAPLMPEAVQSPAGRLDLHASAKGTIGKPTVTGGLVIANGRITIVPMRQKFDKLQLTVRLRGNDIVLERLSARSGPGRASATGKLHLARGDTRARLDLSAKELPIVRPGLPIMKLTSKIGVELDATGKQTEVEIVAKKSVLDVFTKSIPAPKKIPTSDGVVYTDVRSKRAKAERAATNEEPMVPKDVKVSFRLADPIFIRGPQANMTWRGAIELEHRSSGVEGEKGALSASGALTADGGRINLLGNDFEIDHGRVTMPEVGEVDPYIDLVATTQLPDASVDVIVRGRASRPELRFTSDPPMPESDVFALLVTGTTSSDQEGTDVQTKAASLLAAFQNPVLQRELQDSLGIDRVGVAFGDDVDQPIVTVGKRVSKKVYVETRYHHNAPRDENTAELQVEYMFKPPAWSVETFFGDAAKGGIGLWWRRRFGGHAPKVEKAGKAAKAGKKARAATEPAAATPPP